MLIPKISVEDYLSLDRASEFKSEYHDGELFPIVAVSLKHSIVGVNTARRLAERLDNTPCRVVGSSIRVRVSPTKFVYPDILVVCGKPALTDETSDTMTNPKVIVEILSPATADYDYGAKFAAYRNLPSFEEYLLIAQDKPRVEVFRKASENRWVLTTYEGYEAMITVESLNLTLPMKDLYSGVE